MVVHSIMMCSPSSKKVIFSKFFSAHHGAKDNIISEQRQLLHMEPYWQSALVDGSVRSLTMGDIHVVFQMFGSVLLLISGKYDIDELILADVMKCLQHVLSATLGSNRQESSLLEADNYAKLCILLDEIVPQGIIECLDPDAIVTQSKLKNA